VADQIQRTLVLVKPDAVEERHIGQVITALEEVEEFSIIALKVLEMTDALARTFYIEHEKRDFYNWLVRYMSTGLIAAIVVEGRNAIPSVRELIGDTDPANARLGTIRRRFGFDKSHNAVHASSSVEAAEREISLIFSEDEIWDFESHG
jgi:nucleoside-diphosphate kinase